MKKLFWIDMEMTGLDPEKEVIIEVAALVTDMELNVLEGFETVVRQAPRYLENMDDWNKEHHSKSGLTAKVPFGMDQDVAEEKLLALVAKHFPVTGLKEDLPVLAGNSIGQDRAFINRHMTQLASKLHYRVLDVSSWKIIFNERYGLKYEKKGSHRALDDVRESIEELKFYLRYFSPEGF